MGLFASMVGAQEPSRGTVVVQSRPDEAPVADTQPQQGTTPEITDTERAAVRITAYDMDTRITPAASRMETRARVTVRNEGKTPLKVVALQVSSSLAWESVTMGERKIAFRQHKIDTDADHTGQASELVVTLAEPLAPGASATLDTFYSGTIEASSARLTRLGASSSAASNTDWDEISAETTALRGFGNVLWYPVAAPQLFLGQGADLFDAVNAARLRNQSVTMAMRVSVAYEGDSLDAVYFDGRRAPLKAIPDDPNAPISVAKGIATATFAAEPIGFRVPSLFLLAIEEKMGAPVPNFAGTSTHGSSMSSSEVAAFIPNSALLAVASEDDGAISTLVASAEKIAPMLQVWFGAEPLSALTVIDHPGQPFEDGPLLVAPVASLGTADAAPALTHSMTHAFVQTGRPWIDEGLAQFSALLWTEHELGRDAAVAQLDELVQPLAVAEPEIEKDTPADAPLGQPLIAASSEMFYRRKAAAVWVMLRSIVGDEALAEALTTFRQRTPKSTDTPESDAVAFEHVLEHAGHQNAANPIDLRWFFRDWVLRDRGLPDLSIVDVVPREVAASQGRKSGYFVAVNVRNDGSAEVQVPVMLHTQGGNTLLLPLRVPAFGVATARTVTETPPTDVQVNDGTVPELKSSVHKLTVSSIKPE